MLWLAGRGKFLRQGAGPALVAGLTAGFTAIGMNALGLITLTGIAAGLAVIVMMMVYLKATGRKLIDRSVLTEADRLAEKRISLAAALSPWLILVACSLLVNAPFLPFLDLTFKKLEMALPIIPGAPEKVRLFWQAYFWILASSVLAFPFLKPSPDALRRTFSKWRKRAPRPVFAAAIFFAIAFVINHSGKTETWQLVDPARNMIHVLAGAAAGAFGRLYVLVAPFLGLLGGFVSGSESSAIAMLTPLHLSAAEKIGAVGLLVAAASGIGGGLASVISPAKLQNAAASIDRIGEEVKVIPATFVISLIITGVVAVMALLWAF
jgi:lactate permease